MDTATPKQRLIIGLGNPGKQYEITRHNMGFLVVQAFAERLGWGFKEEKGAEAKVAKGVINGTNVHLILPTTYMNESGRAVRRYKDYYKVPLADLIVVCDDVDIPFGEIRLRRKGSSGGHNGLKSIEAYLGTQEYVRLRMGIGRQEPGRNLADYVLDPFTQSELAALAEVVINGSAVLERLMKETTLYVMNSINRAIDKRDNLEDLKEKRLGEK